MANDTKPSSDNYDIFIKNHVYPDPEGIFSFKPKTVSEAKKTGLIVLDTNTLLVPYIVGRGSLDQIKRTYRQLIKQKRLFVPGQAVREFAKNRTDKLSELYQQFNRRLTPKYASQGRYPLLESTTEYQGVLVLEQKLSDLEKEYIRAVEKVLDRIRGWGWNDPVSALYRELFSEEAIHDPTFNPDEIRADLDRRKTHKLPPGYKDGSKDDQGIGDLLIWHSILDLAAKKKETIIFVSSDQKPDWWCQSEGQALYPRYELVDEFRRASGGQTILIVKFSELMEIFGAEKAVVQEVRQQEVQIEYVSRSNLEARDFGQLAENAVYDWLVENNPEASVEINKRPSQFDTLVIQKNGEMIGVEVKAFRTPSSILASAKEWKMEKDYALPDQHLVDQFYLVVILNKEQCFDQRTLIKLKNSFLHTKIPEFSLICGYLTEDHKFVATDTFRDVESF